MSNKTTVWDGVKIGCGAFIVLPAIILAVLALIVAVPTCHGIRDAKERGKQRAHEQNMRTD